MSTVDLSPFPRGGLRLEQEASPEDLAAASREGSVGRRETELLRACPPRAEGRGPSLMAAALSQEDDRPPPTVGPNCEVERTTISPRGGCGWQTRDCNVQIAPPPQFLKGVSPRRCVRQLCPSLRPGEEGLTTSTVPEVEAAGGGQTDQVPERRIHRLPQPTQQENPASQPCSGRGCPGPLSLQPCPGLVKKERLRGGGQCQESGGRLEVARGHWLSSLR